jgi:hypothetical protein
MRAIVSYDVRVAGIIEVEGVDEEDIEEQVKSMNPAALLKQADPQTAIVEIDGMDIQ